MSGALVTHRPGSKPLFIGGQAVYREPRPGMWPACDVHNVKRTLRPNGFYKNGRPTGYTVTIELRQRHVLNYVEAPDRPSKHARGRTRPRTRAEQARMANIRRRAIQARKSMTVDMNRYAAIYDEL